MTRFGPYQIDPAARELRKGGVRIRIQYQPFQVLEKLLEHPGEVVTRDVLIRTLWPDDEYGEFDLGLNTAVKKLRKALHDSATEPEWIETIPRVGYRFLGEAGETAPASLDEELDAELHGGVARRWEFLRALAGLFMLAAVLVALAGREAESPSVVAASSAGSVSPAAAGRVVGPVVRSPDGGMVAYAWRGPAAADSDLYIEVVDSGRLLRLTRDPADDLSPAWSPDGRRIAFLREKSPGGEVDLMVVPAPAGPERRLATLPSQDASAASVSWAAGGARLVFSSGSLAEGPLRIGLVDVESGAVEWVTAPEFVKGGEEQERSTPEVRLAAAEGGR